MSLKLKVSDDIENKLCHPIPFDTANAQLLAVNIISASLIVHYRLQLLQLILIPVK